MILCHSLGMRTRVITSLVAILALTCTCAADQIAFEMPKASADKKIVLVGSDARFQCLVSRIDDRGNARDVSRSVRYRLESPNVATIDANGRMIPISNGVTVLTAETEDGLRASVPVEVTRWDDNPRVSFVNQVVPVFTKHGCNGGGCHGKAAGQNGFKLSLLGFEWQEDHAHLVKESRGRRIQPSAPDESLLLTKSINRVPHGGGLRFEQDSDEYRILRRWITQGMPASDGTDPSLVSIEVIPSQRRLLPKEQQQLSVIATYSDGLVVDVTRGAQFESNDTVMADVSRDGLVAVKEFAGEAGVMARYQGQVAVFRASVPIEEGVATLPPATNPIDAAVFQQLAALNIPLSQPADDLTFLRRITLDIAGRLPTTEEVQECMADQREDRRAQWIDQLLDSDEYAEHFANRWMLILRNRRENPGQKSGSFAFHRWIKEQIQTNRPYDQFVRDILTASGSIESHPPVTWYRQVPDTFSRLEDAAQLFIGQRLQCARCHHHPQEKWGQTDYFRMAAFFSAVKTKPGLSPDDFTVMSQGATPRASHPKSGKSLAPAGLDQKELADPLEKDPREYLADWMTNSNNPFFAKAIANRYWKHFFGRGLVEPEDDMRVTNPSSNPELLNALEQILVESRFDLKHFIRSICNSQVYQLSSEPNGSNLKDRKCFSRYYPKRLSAEQIVDSIDQVTGVRTVFDSLPVTTRAVDLPDTAVQSYFLTVFGRPDAKTACECERATESTLAQSLHFANSKELAGKIGAAESVVNRFSADKDKASAQVTELYVRAFSRHPNASESHLCLQYLESRGYSASAYQDLLWSLLNTKEFLFITKPKHIHMCLEDKHTIAVTEESISFFNGFGIGFHDEFT